MPLPGNVLSMKKFKEIPAGQRFAQGEMIDDPAGLHILNSGNFVRWVAVKGYANDWCIYCHWATESFDSVARNGDKVVLEHNIQKVVPCTQEVYARYRL